MVRRTGQYRRDSVRRTAWWVGGGPAIAAYRATATYVDDTDVAIIGAFIGPVTHTASVTMTMEPP